MPVGHGRDDPLSDDGDPKARKRREANRRGLAFVDAATVVIHPPALDAVPVVLQSEYEVLPIRLDVGTLYVAMAEVNEAAVAALGSFTGCRIVPVIGEPEHFAEARWRSRRAADEA